MDAKITSDSKIAQKVSIYRFDHKPKNLFQHSAQKCKCPFGAKKYSYINYRMFGGRDVQKYAHIWICEALSAVYEHVSCRVPTKTSRKTLCFVPGFRRKNTVSNAISLKHKKESRKKISPPNGGEVLKSQEITKIFA